MKYFFKLCFWWRGLSLFILFFLQCTFSFSQNENDKWIFGGTVFPTAPAALNFSNGNPVATTPSSSFYSGEPATAVSDFATGNLLFYSNSTTVYNSSHSIMPNGSGIMGCGSSTQGALIIRKPCNTLLYYLFTVDCIENSLTAGLRFSIVDMSLASGSGDIVASSKNISMWPSRVVEKLVATKHANGRDYWIVVHEWNSNNFLSFLLDSAGISLTPVISSAGAVHTSGNSSTLAGEGIGSMCISQDGSKLALVTGHGAMNVNEIFNFNNATGAVSGVISIPSNGEDYGVAISPDNTKLYTTTWVGFPLSGRLYQYDLTSGNASTINASETIIATAGSGQAFGALQYAKNGKIYLARVLGTALGVINNPNNPGASCNYVNAGVSLSSRVCRGGLANAVVYHATICAPVLLPVELGHFSAGCYSDNIIRVSWSSYSEINNNYFLVEKSLNGHHYSSIGKVEGKGNSSAYNEYEFYDTQFHSPLAYYRLKQVDFDGKFEYSTVVAVKQCDAYDAIRYYYSPVNNSLTIYPQHQFDKRGIRISVFTSTGQIIVHQEVSFENESLPVSISLPLLQQGIYLVSITDGIHISASRIISEGHP